MRQYTAAIYWIPHWQSTTFWLFVKHDSYFRSCVSCVRTQCTDRNVTSSHKRLYCFQICIDILRSQWTCILRINTCLSHPVCFQIKQWCISLHQRLKIFLICSAHESRVQSVCLGWNPFLEVNQKIRLLEVKNRSSLIWNRTKDVALWKKVYRSGFLFTHILIVAKRTVNNIWNIWKVR